MSKYKKLLCICFMILIPIFTLFPKASYGGDTISPVLYEEESEDTTGNDFITEALRSLDENTAQEELTQNYLYNFYHSSQTAMTKSFNIFQGETIVMVVINFFTMLIEMIGIAVTFFVMVLYNFVSASFLGEVVNDIISGIEKIMFDWSDMNSWIIKVLVISTLVGIAYRLIKDFTRIRGYKQVLQIALSAVVSMTFVIFIGRNGRNIIKGIEDSLQNMIVETFVFDGQSGNMEIANKENIFDTMQFQPFMLRHFGTTSYEKIASSADQSVDEAKARVQKLLDDPSKDNAVKEYEDYGNNAISHDISSTGTVFFLSIITLIHKVLIGAIIGVICILVGAVKLLKELLLWLSVYQLILWMIKRTNKAQQWFTDRLMWSLLAIGADILFSTALYFIMQICTKVSAIHPLFLIGFDVLLLILTIYAFKHLDKVSAWLKEDGSDMLKTMLVGSSTPLQVYNNERSKHKRNQRTMDDETEDKSSDDDGIVSDEDLSESEGSGLDPLGEDLSDRDNGGSTEFEESVANQNEADESEKAVPRQNSVVYEDTTEEKEQPSEEDRNLEDEENDKKDDHIEAEDPKEKNEILHDEDDLNVEADQEDLSDRQSNESGDSITDQDENEEREIDAEEMSENNQENASIPIKEETVSMDEDVELMSDEATS